jgi:hypothetical protein
MHKQEKEEDQIDEGGVEGRRDMMLLMGLEMFLNFVFN